MGKRKIYLHLLKKLINHRKLFISKMAEKRSGTNSQGNEYTQYGGSRGNFSYKNQDGSSYYNAGPSSGSFYKNPGQGYQHYQSSSGSRTYQPCGPGTGSSKAPTGTNSQGNAHTSYGDGHYQYNNQDGSQYYTGGDGRSSYYQNADKGYAWRENPSGDRTYHSHGKSGRKN